MTEQNRVEAMLGKPVDLLAIDTSEPRSWTRGARRIMRPGLRSIWFGSRGAGKSLAAMIVAIQVIEAGGSVAYLDWENGPRRQAERLEAILEERGAPVKAAVKKRLDYRPMVRLSKLTTLQAVAEWGLLFAGRDLVIIDSATRALGQLGLDENAAQDFAAFTTRYIDPLSHQEIAVLLLDNTGHEEKDRTRGSSAKLDLCELAYRVTSSDIAPERTGTITLERMRTRDGDEARQLVAHVGDGTYTTVHQPEQTERQAAVEDMLLAHIQAHPGSTSTEIAKAVGLRRVQCASRLAILEDPGTGTGTITQCPSEVRDSRGVPHKRKGWYLASQSQLATVPENGTGTDNHSTAPSGCPGSPSLKDGTGTASADLERAEAVASRARQDGVG